MKFPNHIILDVKITSNKQTIKYWTSKYIFNKIYNYKNEYKFYFNNFLNFINSYNLIIKNNINKVNNSFIFLLKKKNVLNNFKKLNTVKFINFKLWNLFDINFLRKERIYTKLKYSRTPQYDIVSGGVAAIFSGFLGFLICEKFGLELLDSGDFYFLFMYCVFLSFFIRLLLKLINNNVYNWNFISLKWIYFFYKIILTLTIKNIKNNFKIIYDK